MRESMQTISSSVNARAAAIAFANRIGADDVIDGCAGYYVGLGDSGSVMLFLRDGSVEIIDPNTDNDN